MKKYLAWKRIAAFLLGLVLFFGSIPSAVYAGEISAQTQPGDAAELEKEIDVSDSILQTGGFVSEKDVSADQSLHVGKKKAAGTKTAGTDKEAVMDLLYKTATGWDGTSSYVTAKMGDVVCLKEDLPSIYSQFVNENPDLFYLTGRYRYSYSSSGNVFDVNMYCDPDRFSLSDVTDFRNTASSILSQVESSWSDEQKALFLHDYIVTHCEYDFTFSNYTAYHTLVTGSSVCQGYTLAYYYLLKQCGIEANVITSNDMNHAWNQVTIDGEKYYTDCTWDDPGTESGSPFYQDYCKHINFLRSQDGITQTGHNSTDWVDQTGAAVYGTETGSWYENAWWSETITAIPHVGDLWAYAPAYGDEIYVHDYASGSDRKLVETGAYWPVWDGGGYYYSNTYIHLAADNTFFYASAADQIYQIGTDGTLKVFYELTNNELATGYIYGIRIEDDTLYYRLYTSYDSSSFVEEKYINLSTHTHKWDAGVVTQEATCTEDGVKTYTCKRCGETKTEVIKAAGHTEAEDPAVEATCTEPGKTAGSHCLVCGEVFKAQEIIPAKGHQFGNWETNGEENHKHTCSVCGAEETEVHAWGEPEITKEATEDEEGLRTYTCLVCDQTRTEVIPKTDHVHHYTDTVMNPTCTEQGYTLHKCEKCGDEYKDAFTEALGHSFGEWITVTEATCTEPGNRERSCNRCEEKETVVIPAAGHSPVRDPAADPTCTKPGKTAGSHCSVCGEVILAQETVPAKGHQFGDWTSTGKENHKHTCTVCGEEESKAHTWGAPVITKEPTETEEGIRTYTCTVCGQTKTEPIPVLVKKGWIRLAGNGRYDTMSEIVNEGFSSIGGTVVVATGTGFKDALAAAGLAGIYDAPVILTDGKSLSHQTQEQLERLQPSQVFIAGGEAAVSKNVFQSIQTITGVEPDRLAGQTSAGTSAALATAGSGWSDTAIIATNKTFKDALSAAPLSFSLHMPILLADNGKSLNADVLNALKKCGIRNVIIVGGKLAVTENVENQLIRNGIDNISRIAGNTAVDTSADIATFGLQNGLTINGMGVATSQNYPDALAGAALCGHNNSVLVLADEKAMKNTSFPTKYKDDFVKGYVFGGTLAVSDKVVKALEAAVK